MIKEIKKPELYIDIYLATKLRVFSFWRVCQFCKRSRRMSESIEIYSTSNQIAAQMDCDSSVR